MDVSTPEAVTTRKTHGNAKLTWEQVNLIRDMFDAAGYSIPTLSRMFGVTATAIWLVVTNQTWRDSNYTNKRGRRVLPVRSGAQNTEVET